MSDKSIFWHDGYEYAKQGFSIMDNPYPRKDWRFKQWEDGFNFYESEEEETIDPYSNRS